MVVGIWGQIAEMVIVWDWTYLCLVAFQNGTPVFWVKLRVRETTAAYFSKLYYLHSCMPMSSVTSTTADSRAKLWYQ